MRKTLQPLAFLSNGTPVYPIRGAEKGYNTEGDVLVKGQVVNPLWDEFNETLNLRNAERSAIEALLSFRTIASAEDVPQTGEPEKFDVASEYGEPTALRWPSTYNKLAFPFVDYDKASRFTWRFLRDATADQISAQHNRMLEADNRLTTEGVLYRLPNNTTDENEFFQTVYPLYNGDTMKPPPFMTHDFVSPHTHYLTSGSTALDGVDLEDTIRHVTEHGYGTTPGSRLLIFANPAEGDVIRGLRANGTTTMYDFIPAVDAPAFLTDKDIIGQQAPGSFGGLKVSGSYGPAWAVESYMVPPGYVLVAATGGPNSELNPVGFREHADPTFRGLRIIPGNRAGYPLVDSFYTRGFGVGVRHRGAAAVIQVTASGSYTAPTAP